MTGMYDPTVSVVMSVHNCEKHIKEAVDSVLSQTFTDFEFIIVNDGSTDGTADILKSYCDPRIILIHQQNIGLTKSLNRAIAGASGTLIARQDADDRSLPHRLATQVAFLAEHPEIALVGSAVEVISGSGMPLATFRNPANPDEIRGVLRSHNCFCHGSVMFRRDSFFSLAGYDEFFVTAQDYDMWIRFSERFALANLAEPCYVYRFSTDSVTVKKMVSQHRMAVLARRFAAEREGTRLTATSPDEAAAYLSSLLTTEEKTQIIENYKPWCLLLLKNGLLDEATQLMTALFRYHPSPIFRLAYGFVRHINPRSNLARLLEHA